MTPPKNTRNSTEFNKLTQACYRRGLMYSAPANKHLVPKKRKASKRQMIAFSYAYGEEDA